MNCFHGLLLAAPLFSVIPVEGEKLAISKDVLSCISHSSHHVKMTGHSTDPDLEGSSEWRRNREGNYFLFIPINSVSSVIPKRKPRFRNVSLPRVSQQS